MLRLFEAPATPPAKPFYVLRERLLKAGIAPHHVRRYERELSEHLDDLVAMQKAKGYDGEDASLRARALLGPDDELAAAMTARREFRSLAARLPWLVFGVVPPVVIAALLMGVGFTMAGLWHLTPVIPWLAKLPSWWCELATVLAPPLAAVFFTVIAIEQRINWRWPGFAVGLIALLGAFTILVVRFPQSGIAGEIGLGLMATDATLPGNLARMALTAAVVATVCFLMRTQIRRAAR